MLASAGLFPSPASAQSREDFPVEGGWFYTQTRGGQPAGFGFAVTDTAGIPFWTAYKELGGMQRLGYPISHRFLWDGFPAQAFQGGVLHYRADVGVVQIVNVIDWLGQHGFDNWLFATYGAAPSLDWRDDVQYNWDFVKNRHFKLLDISPRIRHAYMSTGADPVTYFGLPQSAIDNGDSVVVRTQRAIFQEWNVDLPWAEKGTVFIVDGGEVLANSGVIPPNALSALMPGPAVALAGFPPVALIQPPVLGTAPRAPAPPPDAPCPPYAPVQPFQPNCRQVYGVPAGQPVPPKAPLNPAPIAPAPIAPAPGPIAPPPATAPYPWAGVLPLPLAGGSCLGDEEIVVVPDPAVANKEFSLEVSSARYTLGVGLAGPGTIRLREVVAGGKGTVWKFAVVAPAGTYNYVFLRDGGASACVQKAVKIIVG